MTRWAQISAGSLHSAQGRLWDAMGERAGLFADRLNNEEDFAKDVAAELERFLLRTGKTGLMLTKTFYLGPTEGRKTESCFESTRGLRWSFKDRYIDRRLPEYQPDQESAPIGVYAPGVVRGSSGFTFRQMARMILRVASDVKMSDEEISRLLVGRGYTVSLPAIEAIAAEFSAEAEDRSFCILALTAGGEKGTAGIEVYFQDGWSAHYHSLTSQRTWIETDRLLVRNMDLRSL